MNWHRILVNLSDSFSNKIDNSIIQYINSHLCNDMNELEKAITIYLCLGDILSYSAEFSLYYNYDKVSPVKEISLDNNEVICKNWSILYNKLLQRYNINSRLHRSNAHYRVEIVINNVIYSADATGYGGGGLYYSMSDIARIKYGFKIHKFVVSNTVDPNDTKLFSESFGNLKEIINDVYRKQNRKYYLEGKIDLLKYKVIKAIINNAQKVGVGTPADVDYRVKIINRFWALKISEFPLEKAQLFNYFFGDLFEDYDEWDFYEYKCFNIYASVDGRIVIYKLIALDLDGKCYYYMDDGNKFKKYSSRELLLEFMARDVKISDYIEIPGIYGLESYKVK